jgi:hypothetical protein
LRAANNEWATLTLAMNFATIVTDKRTGQPVRSGVSICVLLVVFESALKMLVTKPD